MSDKAIAVGEKGMSVNMRVIGASKEANSVSKKASGARDKSQETVKNELKIKS